MNQLGVSLIGRELLDDPQADPDRVRTSLGNIQRANRWLGGYSAIRFGLGRLLPFPVDRPLTLLDVGTGAGDVPLMLAEWARRRGIALRPMGLERSWTAARLAAAAGVPLIYGCGGALPVGDRAVDLVVVSQLAHHLDPAGCIALFREADRIARHGVAVADLRHAPLAGIGFRVAGRLLRFDDDTLRDGVISLRRGFTRGRFAKLLEEAEIKGAKLYYRPGARLVACWRRS